MQDNKYKYDYLLSDSTTLENCQDFDLDMRFVYYFNDKKKFNGNEKHVLIDRKTGLLFAEANNYARLKNLFLNKLKTYEKTISTPYYFELCTNYVNMKNKNN